jgi:dTDP-4-amino-4,6-dideoxygalactose transaminase
MPSSKIPLFKVFLAPEEVLMGRLKQVPYSGQISEGEPVREFEVKFGEYIGEPKIRASSPQ